MSDLSWFVQRFGGATEADPRSQRRPASLVPDGGNLISRDPKRGGLFTVRLLKTYGSHEPGKVLTVALGELDWLIQHQGCVLLERIPCNQKTGEVSGPAVPVVAESSQTPTPAEEE